MKAIRRDNSTKREKLALRKLMMRQIDGAPVVMETHGGVGQIWASCYAHLARGVVFEKDAEKAAILAQQRPTWAVYEADCVSSLAGGAGDHLVVDVLDVDPYGQPWPTIEAFFSSERPRAACLWVVVQDGLKQKIKAGGAWAVKSLAGIVKRFGNDLLDRYIDVCRILLEEHASQAGYSLARFSGYYCGASGAMTHYLARLEIGG